MSSIWDTILEHEPHGFEEQIGLEHIPSLKLSEFAKRKMGVLIYSSILNEEIWLCSDRAMAEQIKKDDPRAACYTVEELRELIQLHPSAQDLRKIHETKTVFPSSSIIKSETKESLVDRMLAELDKEIPADLDSWLGINDQELAARIFKTEEEINEVCQNGTIADIKAAFERYRDLYTEARNKRNKRKK